MRLKKNKQRMKQGVKSHLNVLVETLPGCLSGRLNPKITIFNYFNLPEKLNF